MVVVSVTWTVMQFMLASWLQSRFGISFSYCFSVHVPTSLEEGVLQDPTLNLLIYHFVKSSSYVLVQFLWSSQYLSPLIDSTFMTFFHKASPWAATATGLSSRWTGPEKPTAIASCYKSLKIYSISRPSPHHDSIQSWPCFFPKKSPIFTFQMDKFHFQGPQVCVFTCQRWKAPLQFVAGFSLILFLTTNPRWWNFKYFFNVHPPTNWGKMMNPIWRERIFFRWEKTHQPANNKSSCLELSPGESSDLLPKESPRRTRKSPS